MTAERWIAVAVGLLLMAAGAGCIEVLLGQPSSKPEFVGAATALLLVGAGLAIGGRLRRVKVGPVDVTVEEIMVVNVPARQLLPHEEDSRREYAKRRRTPDRQAPPFSLLKDSIDYRRFPHAKPTTPMYVLDSGFRLLDWNEAFSLAFDNTAEGRLGQSVLEWVFFLENWKAAIDRGEVDFAEDPDRPIHVEPLRFSSAKFGKFEATKRAHRIYQDDGKLTQGWIVLLELAFDDSELESRYYADLDKALAAERVWEDYARSYDPVLTNTLVYPKLLDSLSGRDSRLQLDPVPEGARVLDLGAGTGNLAFRLAEPDEHRVVFAVEKSEAMLGILRRKCAGRLRQDDLGPGVIPVKQDVRSLFGIPEGTIDVALSNNVLYALSNEDAIRSLAEAHKVLRRGGELRISGPHEGTNLNKLFRQIRRDLRRGGKLDELERDLKRVENVNETVLAHMDGFRRPIRTSIELLKKAGFEDVDVITKSAYAGQSIILRSVKS